MRDVSKLAEVLLIAAMAAQTAHAWAATSDDKPSMLRIDSADQTVRINSVEYRPGEVVLLMPGEHYVSIAGSYFSRLSFGLVVAQSGITMTKPTIEDRCAGPSNPGDPRYEVVSWSANLMPDTNYANLTALLVQGPQYGARTRQLKPCPAACCGWDEQRAWKLSVASTPKGAMILVDGKYIASTDQTLSVPYGVARSGAEQDPVVRVARPDFVGCTWRLSEIKRQGLSSVACAMQEPQRRVP